MVALVALLGEGGGEGGAGGAVVAGGEVGPCETGGGGGTDEAAGGAVGAGAGAGATSGMSDEKLYRIINYGVLPPGSTNLQSRLPIIGIYPTV